MLVLLKKLSPLLAFACISFANAQPAPAALPASAPAATPAPPRVLKVVAFDGGWNLPMWAAQRQGFFEQQGLAVQLSFTPNSGFLINGLLGDRFDIAIASIDNLIAYQEGQGDGPPPKDPDLFAFMGGDNGFLSLVAAAPIKRLADMRGHTLAVDSLNTGFAFVARELLQRNGLGDSDVSFVRGGATGLRYRDLTAGKYDATLLRTPFEILAGERGFNTLATADSLGAYLGSSGMARRSWARDNEAALIGFMRAYRKAIDWIYDPANRPVVEALLVANTRDMTPALAKPAAALLLAEKGGLIRDVALDMKGLQTVIALRGKYGEPKKTLGEPGKYVDTGYYDKAFEAAGRR